MEARMSQDFFSVQAARRRMTGDRTVTKKVLLSDASSNSVVRRMNYRFGIVLLCLTAGCAHFKEAPISPAETARALESRSLDSAALKAFLEQNLHSYLTNWPAKTWDLETLTMAAFFYHPSLDVARAQWAVAKAGELTAGRAA